MRLDLLLADPALGLELVAGRVGVASRGPIRWATTSDLPDPTPWLEGGEVLLTTGLGVRGDPEAQRRLIAAVDRRGVAAVGFGVGVIEDEVPPALVAEAEARGLPLFIVPLEVPFIAVAKRVSHHIFSEHYATLRAAVDLHRTVLATVLGGGGVAGVLATVMTPMPGASAVAYDYYGQVLAAHDPAGLAALLSWDAVAARRQDRERFELVLREGAVATGAWLRVADELEAALVVLTDRPLSEPEALLFEQGLTGVSLELARGLSIREAHRARIDELLEDAATGRASSESLQRRLHRFGLDPRAPFGVLAVAPDRRASVRALCVLAEDALESTTEAREVRTGAGDPRPAAGDGLAEPAPGEADREADMAAGSSCAHALVGHRDGLAFAVVQPPARQPEQLLGAARARGLVDVRIGWSGAVEGVDRLGAALAEAAAAATAPGPGGVRDVASLGLPGLLAGLAEDSGTRAFVSRVIGPVLEHDAREGTSLADSLRAYLRHGCRPGPAAAELCIHRHTLSYRLERVAELTGNDPRDGRHLLEFGLALELAARVRA